MDSVQRLKAANSSAHQNGTQNGNIHQSYDTPEAKYSKSAPAAASPYGSDESVIGSKSSVKGSIMSLVHQKLSHSKTDLQSSWVNVVAPVPFGASHPAINIDEQGNPCRSHTEIDKEKNAPADRFYIVYMIFLLHGLSFLLPWNMFLTANSYFTDFKFAPTGNQTESGYAKNFLSYVGIAAQIPNVILCFLNIFFQSKTGSKTIRIAGSIGVLIVMFIITIILAIVDSQEWPGTFFGVTMASVVIINSFGGLYQSSTFGMAGPFPMKYTNAVIIGSNASGIFTALTMITSLLLAENLQLAATWYFEAAILVLCLAIITYFLLPFQDFYKHFTKPHGSNLDEDSQKALLQKEELETIREKTPYVHILKKTWKQLLGVGLTFFVTLVCFPAIQADIKPSDPDFFIPDHLYTPITTFLFYNFFAALGNLATELKYKPGPKYIIIPIVLRLLYIPFFLICNYRPDVRSFPVYINNDYVYFLGGITMAFTNGYFSSLCLMYAPSLVENRWAGTAAVFGTFFLILGIVIGVNFTLLLAKIIEVI
ncbi:equilibrative nucleoside transporter 1-like [Watersipora subatra]|uniref:equilibrative nucleoside transporter 1-like n=1 Tax=Watersipora subatra TaxID=2589382 RepID=UPI00355B43FC